MVSITKKAYKTPHMGLESGNKTKKKNTLPEEKVWPAMSHFLTKGQLNEIACISSFNVAFLKLAHP